MVISRPKMTLLGQFAPPCASTRRGLSDGVDQKIYPQNSIFLKSRIQARLLGEVGVKKVPGSRVLVDLLMRVMLMVV